MDTVCEGPTIIPPSRRACRLTFEQLAHLQPLLLDLRRAALNQSRCRAMPRWLIFYQHYKPALSRLVGWHAPADADPQLRTCQAYETVYREIYEALHSRRARQRATPNREDH